MEFSGLLSVIVFLPLAGALAIVLLLKSDSSIRWFAGATSFVGLLLSLYIFTSYDTGLGGVQLVDRLSGWVPAIAGDKFAVEYYMGIDGLSAPLVLLTGILGFVAVVASWHIRNRVKEYFAWILVLQTGVLGVFTSLDFLMFFLFWELELIPMYFLIAIW